MTDFDAKAREIVAGYDGCPECMAKIAAALKAAWNDALEEAARVAAGSYMRGGVGADIAEAIRAQKVQP